jgi:hypothetical protein
VRGGAVPVLLLNAAVLHFGGGASVDGWAHAGWFWRAGFYRGAAAMLAGAADQPPPRALMSWMAA